MIKKYDIFILKIGSINNYSFYLSLARVFFSLLILKQIFEIWNFIPLLYENKSFLVSSSDYIVEFIPIKTLLLKENIYLFFGIYIFVVIINIFGIGKYVTAFFLFVMFDITQKLCFQILNGGDNILRFVLMYMIFADSYNYFVLNKLQKNSTDQIFYRNVLSNLIGFIICIHLCLVYFITGLHKIHSDVWFHGVATYYTLQMERFRGTTINSLLANNIYFVTFSTYFTVFVEMFYPSLVWFKQTKKLIVICMIMLHLGIYIFMMIHDFQIIFIFLQGFFFSNRQWITLFNKLIIKLKFVLIYFKIQNNIQLLSC